MTNSEKLDATNAPEERAPEDASPALEGVLETQAPGDAGIESDATQINPELDPETLRARLIEVEGALQESRDMALRAQAELENLRRRAARDVENAHKFGVEKLVAEILPVVDSMELGMQAADQEGADVATLREGTELTLKKLTSALAKFDVVEVNPAGAHFDPERHQAMTAQPAEGVEAGTVLQVFQKGYTLAGRLVRPAMVVVAQ